MALVFVLHEATRTGAPRLGALIARELARETDLHLLVMRDGPLTPWLRQTLGVENVTICRDDRFSFRVPFETRLQSAREMLEEAGADFVYVNSLASSVFALAARASGLRSLVHVHEKSADIVNLLEHELTKLEVMAATDALVLAGEDIREDVAEVFRYAPPTVTTMGTALDAQSIRTAAAERIAPARNAQGRALEPGERLIVGMCGHASHRKGADIFLACAAALPEHDFLWIGGWHAQETPDNIALPAYERDPPPNLYLTGAVDNPYPHLAATDLFFLSSREDPNPLVVGEAWLLGRPVFAFSGATSISDRIGRFGVLCHGRANVEDAVRVLKACDAPALRRPGFREVAAEIARDYDLQAKTPPLRGLIASLRGAASAAPAPQDAQCRQLGEGVVELTFT